MDGGAWEAAVHGVLKSPTEQLHFHFSLSCIGEGNDNPFQCSCLENPRDGGAWLAAVYGVTQSWTWLSDWTTGKRINDSKYKISSYKDAQFCFNGKDSLEMLNHQIRVRLGKGLEKEMASHSSILAWRIPGMGEPGGLLSMGSHRVGHDWSDLAAAAAATDSQT